MESENNKEVEKLIESLQKQLIQQKNEYAELYDELKYDENLLEAANMIRMIDNVRLFINTYEMLKNDYLKGYITEDNFFEAMVLNVDRMKKLLKQEETSNEDNK